MSFSWDDVKGKISEVKDSAGKYAKIALDKTNTVVDITKLNFAKNDTEGKITKLYAKIGEKIYNEYLQGAEYDGEIGELMTEIDKFKDEIKEIEEQLRGLKKNVVCKNCGATNEQGNDFCFKCGEKLVETDDAEPSADEFIDVAGTDE